MATLLGALLVFGLRITDVSIGTVRVILMVRGQRLPSVLLGFLESCIFIFAISRVFKDINEPGNWPKMVAYAAGFATGTFVGMTLERFVASGWILARVVAKETWAALADALRQASFGVTVMHGHGREGETAILFIVAPRRRGSELLRIVRTADPQAFITIDNVQKAIGGYVPHAVAAAQLPAQPAATSVRK